jgi:hypothetical protein
MKVDPAKSDNARLVAALKKLSGFAGAEPRDWAADTIKTLQAGRLEDFDIDEFVSQEYETRLAAREDRRPVWELSRALLALIDELRARGIRAPKAARIGDLLKGWTQDAE